MISINPNPNVVHTPVCALTGIHIPRIFQTRKIIAYELQSLDGKSPLNWLIVLVKFGCRLIKNTVRISPRLNRQMLIVNMGCAFIPNRNFNCVDPCYDALEMVKKLKLNLGENTYHQHLELHLDESQELQKRRLVPYQVCVFLDPVNAREAAE